MFKKTLISFVLVTILFSTPIMAAKKALVVGIGDYPHVSKLNGPQQDAKNINRLLIDDLGFKQSDVMMLLDDKASRNGIMNAIDSWLVNGTSTGDEVFFYFSGHGFQKPDENGDESDGKDEALAPYDAKMVNRKILNMISDDEMELALSRLDDRAATIVIDSCHSGTLTRGLFDSGQPNYEKTIHSFNELASVPTKDIILAHRKEVAFLDNTPNRVVWSAVSAWQKALVDFEKRDGSVFTNYFIKGLKEKAADTDSNGDVTRAELLSYIRKQSKDFCDRNKKFCKTGLTPTLETSKDLYVEEAVTFGESNITNQVIQPINYIDQSLSSPNKSELTLRVLPVKSHYIVGERAKVEINSDKDGYLLVLDINQSDEVTQLYPQESEEIRSRGKILKNSPIQFETEATLPTGEGMLVAVFSTDDVLPSSALESATKDLIVEQPTNYIQDVAHALNSTWTQDSGGNRGVDWTVNKFRYNIIDK